MKILKIFLATITIAPSIISVLNCNNDKKNEQIMNVTDQKKFEHNILMKFIKDFKNQKLNFRDFLSEIKSHLFGAVQRIKDEVHHNPTFHLYKSFESLKSNYWEFRQAMTSVVNHDLYSSLEIELLESFLNSLNILMRNLTTLVSNFQYQDGFDYIFEILKNAKEIKTILNAKLLRLPKKEIYNIKEIIKQYDILYRDFSRKLIGNFDIFEQPMSHATYSSYQELVLLLNNIQPQFNLYIARVLVQTKEEINILFNKVKNNKTLIDEYYKQYQEIAQIIDFLRTEEIDEKHTASFIGLEYKFISLKELFNKTENHSLDDFLNHLQGLKRLINIKKVQITKRGVWDEMIALSNTFKAIEKKIHQKKALSLEYDFKSINEVMNEIKELLQNVRYQGINDAERSGAHTSYWLTDARFINSNIKTIAELSLNQFVDILELFGAFKTFDVELNGYGIYFELYDGCLAFAWLYGLRVCVVNLRTQTPRYL